MDPFLLRTNDSGGEKRREGRKEGERRELELNLFPFLPFLILAFDGLQRSPPWDNQGLPHGPLHHHARPLEIRRSAEHQVAGSSRRRSGGRTAEAYAVERGEVSISFLSISISATRSRGG